VNPECAAHPDAVATHRCDGCARLLCEACYEVGHRLLFCRHCGERALPLAVEGPTSSLELERAKGLGSAYGWAEILQYPFRGFGAYVFVGYAAAFAVFGVFEALPFGGAVTFAPRVLIMLALPSLLLAIVRNTAGGANEIPDWPDFDVGEIVLGVAGVGLSALLTLLPLILLWKLTPCSPWALLALAGGEMGALACLPLTAAALFAGLLLWVPAFGSVAVYETLIAIPRVDLHLLLVARCVGPVVRTALLVTGGMLAGELMAAVLAFLPLVGAALGAVVVAYALFVGTHLVGLLFRNHRDDVEAVYG